MTENMRTPFARQVKLGNKNSSWRSNQETFKNQQFHPAQNDHWRPNYMRAHIYDFSKVVKAHLQRLGHKGQAQVAGKYTRGNNVSGQLKTIPPTNFVL